MVTRTYTLESLIREAKPEANEQEKEKAIMEKIAEEYGLTPKLIEKIEREKRKAQERALPA
jgi:hypothetical protein